MDSSINICRILGNDLPPRHNTGQTYENLAFILKNEAKFSNCTKTWIVNRIVNTEAEESVIDLLELYKQTYIRIPFCHEEYHNFVTVFVESCLAADDKLEYEHTARHAKSLYIMNVNKARNSAIENGIALYDWVMPFDSNCFFTEQGWNAVQVRLRSEKDLSKIFFIPMFRLTQNAQALAFAQANFAEHEPQVAVGKNSNVSFNEFYRYGYESKTELFNRLGYNTKTSELGITVENDKAKCGFVLRLFSGVKEGENLSFQRFLLREEGIKNIIDVVDRQVISSTVCAKTLN